jgi:polysaccharide export outer membrane protein
MSGTKSPSGRTPRSDRTLRPAIVRARRCLRWAPRVAVVAALGVALACGDPPPSEYPTQRQHVEDSTLGPGDVFEVRVFYGSKETSAKYRVDTRGSISFPYIGKVDVAGKTPSDVEADIQKRLAADYLKDPIVSILVEESNSKKVSVFGQVNTAGTYPYTDGMTVVEAISKAGGFTGMARKNAVTVTRTDRGKKTKFTVPVESIAEGKAPNFFMRPGDVIFVDERSF